MSHGSFLGDCKATFAGSPGRAFSMSVVRVPPPFRISLTERTEQPPRPTQNPGWAPQPVCTATSPRFRLRMDGATHPNSISHP